MSILSLKKEAWYERKHFSLNFPYSNIYILTLKYQESIDLKKKNSKNKLKEKFNFYKN